MHTTELDEKYRIFRTQVKERGLTKRTYGSYALCMCLVVGGLALSLFVVTANDSLWVQMLNALFFTFVTVQAGMLGHDFSHGQVFESTHINRSFGMLLWGLAAGLSESAWYKQHNEHHEHVNQDMHDPDINIPFLFKERQHAGSYSFPSYIVRYQHVLFFLSLPIWYISKLVLTWWNTLKMLSTPRGFFECTLAVLHFAVLFGILFFNLSFLTAVAFLVVHIGAAGFYMGSAFAPNHKGEEIIEADAEVTWLNQITSTRNLFPSPFVFHFFGGLNYQVEHHLFPGVSRYQYPKVQKLVKKFCIENNIRYHETTWFGSMKEIYQALKREAIRDQVRL